MTQSPPKPQEQTVPSAENSLPHNRLNLNRPLNVVRLIR